MAIFKMAIVEWTDSSAFWEEIEGLTQQLRRENRARQFSRLSTKSVQEFHRGLKQHSR